MGNLAPTRCDQKIAVNFVASLSGETALWASLERAIIAFPLLPPLLTESLSKRGMALERANVKSFLAETKGAVAFLVEADGAGYRYFAQFSMVAIWAKFEAFCDDFVAARFQAKPVLSDSIVPAIGKATAVPTAVSLDWIARRLPKEQSSVAKATSCLKMVGVRVELLDEELQHLEWCNAARNCVLHSGAHWDRRAEAALARSAVVAGEEIAIKRDDFLALYDVLANIAVEALKTSMAD